MVSGPPAKLQIFWQLYLIELLWFLICSGQFELKHLIYARLSTRLVYFTNSSLKEFQVEFSTSISHLLVKDDFRWFWMRNLGKSILLMLAFLKTPFLVLWFFCCVLMVFLMILSVILPSMLMTLHSSLSAIGFLIFGLWIWILHTRDCGLGQEVPCWFQCRKNSTCFTW